MSSESYVDKFRIGDTGKYVYNCNLYQDSGTLIVEGIFGFCGCGNPEDFLYAHYKELKRIDELNQCDDYDKFYNRFETNATENLDKFELSGLYNMLWYELDKLGFTNHGGSIPGWLTDKGKGLLNDLTKIMNEEGRHD